MGHELSFCELRTKQVVNVIDGKVLGRICDVVFSRQSARVLGFVVPGENAFMFFKRKGDIFIPFERICKIGVDVVLVELKPFHGHGGHGHELLEHSGGGHGGHGHSGQHGHGHSHANPFRESK